VTDFVGSGWAFPVGVDSTGQIALARGSCDIEQAMRLILMTYPGERPMRPRFGSRLRDFVFEGATWENAAAVAAEVRASLAQWEPRATVTDVVVTPEADKPGVLSIDIAYVIKGTNDPRNLVFPFYTIPEHEEEP
jgi:uncharacterized protein